jgi:SAM-dependent methyltransferase
VPTIRGAARRVYSAGRDLAYSRVLPCLVDTSFVVDGRVYEYLWHPLESTWRSERAVELPIGLAELATGDPRRTLEVGNVLRKYTGADASHDVIDKYERAPGVIIADALTYSGGPYDLIVSISTLEHVGYDEQPRDAAKAVRAVENLRRLLSPAGAMLATIPIGYNRELDDALREGSLGARVSYLARLGELQWKQINAEDARGVHGWPWPGTDAVYGWPWPGANVLAVARWRAAA